MELCVDIMRRIFEAMQNVMYDFEAFGIHWYFSCWDWIWFIMLCALGIALSKRYFDER